MHLISVVCVLVEYGWTNVAKTKNAFNLFIAGISINKIHMQSQRRKSNNGEYSSIPLQSDLGIELVLEASFVFDRLSQLGFGLLFIII